MPGIGAWLDFAYSGTTNDPDVTVPCNNFTVSDLGGLVERFAVALPTGVTAINSTTVPNCASTLPLACCTSPSYARLRGYTAFTSTGAIGSRTIANARCNAEFAGTHLCNTTEFRLWRVPSSAMPGIGAWLDFAYSGTTTDPDVNGAVQQLHGEHRGGLQRRRSRSPRVSRPSTAPPCPTAPRRCRWPAATDKLGGMALALLLLTLANVPGAPLRTDLSQGHLTAPPGVLLPAVASSRGGRRSTAAFATPSPAPSCACWAGPSAPAVSTR